MSYGGRGSGAVARGGGRGGWQSGGRGRATGALTPTGTKVVFKNDDDSSDDDGAAPPVKPSSAPSRVVGAKQTREEAEAPRAKPAVETGLTEDGTEVPLKRNNKVFVDGLPFNEVAGAPSLHEQLGAFVHTWKVGRLVHTIKKPGQGFAYLCFHSPNSVDVAVQVLNGKKFLGRALRVELPKGEKEQRAGGVSVNDAKKAEASARQVLVSDLPGHAKPEIIREVIREHAPHIERHIEAIKLTSNGRKAFVTLSSPEEVEPLIAFLHGFSLLGRRVCAVKAEAPGMLPYSKAKIIPRPSPQGDSVITVTGRPAPAGSAAATARYDHTDRGSSDILVGNLAPEATADEVRAHFAHCGRITSCEVLTNKHTRQSMGIARVTFALPGHAKHAAENMVGSRLRGSVLTIDRSSAAPDAKKGAGKKTAEGKKGDAAAAADDDETGSVYADDNDGKEAEEVVDEAAFLRHHGVVNPDKYFADDKDDRYDSDKELFADDGGDDDDEEEHFVDADRRPAARGGRGGNGGARAPPAKRQRVEGARKKK